MKKILTTVVVLLAIVTFALPLSALQMTLDVPFDGTVPSGFPTVTITQDGANQVLVSMSTFPLSGTEFVSEWSFNVNLADPTILTFGYVSGIAVSSIGTGLDAFKADGDGFYDIIFNYPTSNSGPARFVADNTSVYRIMATGLTVADFEVGSVGGNKGSFYSATHVQAKADGSSVWLGADEYTTVLIPEPVTMILLGLGLLGLGIAVRKRS